MNPEEISGTIVWTTEPNKKPYLPKLGLAIPIQQNLLEGTPYNIGVKVDDNGRITTSLNQIAGCVNNITEILAHLHDEIRDIQERMHKVEKDLTEKLESKIEYSQNQILGVVKNLDNKNKEKFDEVLQLGSSLEKTSRKIEEISKLL